jgi:DNA-binding CsgD family transcriptional regulator
MVDAVAAGVEQTVPPSGVTASSVAMIVVDDECRIAEASFGACRLLGRRREQILSRPLTDLLAPAAGDRFEGVWGAVQRTGGHAGPFELAWPHSIAPIDISVTAAVLPGRHLILLSATEVASSPNGSSAGEHPTRRDRGASRGPTSRERQILSMLATGDTDAQIAGKLDLAPATVQTHVRNAKAKLGARTRAQAVAMGLRQGIIDDD